MGPSSIRIWKPRDATFKSKKRPHSVQRIQRHKRRNRGQKSASKVAQATSTGNTNTRHPTYKCDVDKRRYFQGCSFLPRSTAASNSNVKMRSRSSISWCVFGASGSLILAYLPSKTTVIQTYRHIPRSFSAVPSPYLLPRKRHTSTATRLLKVFAEFRDLNRRKRKCFPDPDDKPVLPTTTRALAF